MSYVNQDSLKMQKRRHSVRRVTPEEAVEAANKVVDKANNQIAKALAHAKAWEKVATELYEDNQTLRQQVAELEKENARLRKLARPKAGKKRDEWEIEEL